MAQDHKNLARVRFPHRARMTDLTPLPGRVFVRPMPRHRIGLIILDQDDDAETGDHPERHWTHEGTVVALGAPAKTKRDAEVPHEYAPGSHVYYCFNQGTESQRTILLDGKKHVVLHQMEIMAVIE